LEVVRAAGIHEGDSLTESQVAELARADQIHRAREVALRFLSYRPRSVRELRVRLQRARFFDSVIDEVVARLEEQGLINDAEFARFWRENRESFNPRSTRLIQSELRQRGVSAEMAAAATEGIDEEQSAYNAGQKRASMFNGQEFDVFQRRLLEYLKRRGFNYSIASQAIKRLWDEANTDGDYRENTPKRGM
jgi:regulatory protein